MTPQEILNILIQNMKYKQKNMAFLTNKVDKKINEAMNDTSPIGQLEKKEKIQSLLEHEAYCNARSNAFKEVQEWAEESLKSPELNGDTSEK